MLVSLYLIAFLISLIALFILVIGDRRQNIFYLFAFICVAIANLGYYELATSTTVEKAMLGNALSYFGGALLMFFTVGAILELCNIKKNYKLNTILLLISMGILTLIFTNKYHHLYYKQVGIVFENGVTLLELVNGPLHFLYTIYLVAYFIAMVGISVYTLIKNKEKIVQRVIKVLVFSFFIVSLHFIT